MSLLPTAATFHELVQDCFLAFRGSGLMLAPLDVELIEAWAAQEVPFEVVARGIRRAAETALFDARPGEPPLRTLRACRRAVEAEIKKHLGRSAGKGAEPKEPEQELPVLERRHRKLSAALRKISRDLPALKQAIDRALEGPFALVALSLPEATAREDRADALLVRALPFPARLEVYREASERGQSALSSSARARKLSRRFHRAAVLHRKLELPSLW